MPLQLQLRQRTLRQQHLEAVARGLDVGVLRQQPGQGRVPHPGRGFGVHRRPVPPRRGGPGVLLPPVRGLRPRPGLLVPRVIRAQGGPEGIRLEPVAVPALVEGVLDELLHPEVDVLELGGHQLPVHYDPRRGPPPLAPLVAVLVGRIIGLRVVPEPVVYEVRRRAPYFPVAGVGVVEEVDDVVVDRRGLLAVVEELLQPQVHLVHGRVADRRAHAPRHHRLRVGEFAAYQDVRLFRDAGLVQRLEVQGAGESVHVPHDLPDGPVAVDVGVRRLRPLRQLPQLGVGLADDVLREVRPREHEQVQRQVEQELVDREQVAQHDPQRRRLYADGHLRGQRRSP